MTTLEAKTILRCRTHINDRDTINEIVTMVYTEKLNSRLLDAWKIFIVEGNYVMRKKELV